MTIAEARQIVGKSLGLPAFKVPADLNANDRERLYDGLADYIVRNWDRFDATAREWAGKRIDSPFFRQSLEEYSIANAVSDFSGEFAKQGKAIVTLEAPFVRKALLFGAIGFGLYLAIKAGAAGNRLKAAVKA